MLFLGEKYEECDVVRGELGNESGIVETTFMEKVVRQRVRQRLCELCCGFKRNGSDENSGRLVIWRWGMLQFVYQHL